MEGLTILITGGTGTIGTAIAERLLNSKAKQVIIVSNDEDGLYHAKNSLKDTRYKFVFADVRDAERLVEITKGVDIVFHCAAMKHIPVCEEYPFDAINTNVYGTRNLIKACKINDVKKFVLISTDKAVYPINTMGITKLLAEKLTLDSNYIVVRFGNVLRSRGSVIPFWESQGKAEKYITITDKRMKRYFIEISEAVDLVLAADTPGCIHIKDMEEKSIYALALQIAKKYKCKVLETGIRPGEKLREELMTAEEKERSTIKDGIIIIEGE